jgi:hypothetical protein
MTAVPARRPAHGVLLLCGMPRSAVALCRPRTRDPCPHRAVDMLPYRWEPKSSSLEERTAEQRRSQTYGALRQVLRRACLLYHLTSAFTVTLQCFMLRASVSGPDPGLHVHPPGQADRVSWMAGKGQYTWTAISPLLAPG